MSLASLFRKRTLVLPPTLEATVATWKRLPAPIHSFSAAKTDWLVVDTETSGLDPKRDRLLAIGACRLLGGAIDLSASMEIALRQDQPSARANVLVHSIGHDAQVSGGDPREALAGFLAFAGKSFLAGFHTLFDVHVLGREMRERLGVRFRPFYVDLALLLPALFARPANFAGELDTWLQHFGVRSFARHSALGDALCSAELLLIALRQAQRQGIASVAELAALQKRRNWSCPVTPECARRLQRRGPRLYLPQAGADAGIPAVFLRRRRKLPSTTLATTTQGGKYDAALGEAPRVLAA